MKSQTTFALRSVPAPALLLLALPILSAWLLRRFTDLAGTTDARRVAYATASWATLALLALVLHHYRVPWRAIGVRAPRAGDWPLALVGLLAGVFVAYPIASGINALLGTPLGTTLQHPTTTVEGIAIQLFYAVVTAPVAEELLFRGLLITWLRSRGMSVGPACAISIVLFATIHIPGFGVGGFVFILLWATIPTALFIGTESLAPGWLVHTSNNVLAYLVFPFL